MHKVIISALDGSYTATLYRKRFLRWYEIQSVFTAIAYSLEVREWEKEHNIPEHRISIVFSITQWHTRIKNDY